MGMKLSFGDPEPPDEIPVAQLKINQSITLHGTKETISNVMFLRQLIHGLIVKRLEAPKEAYTVVSKLN